MCRFSCLESIKAFKDIWTCGNFAFLRDQCLLPCNSMVHICLIQTRVRTVLFCLLKAQWTRVNMWQGKPIHTDSEPVLGWLMCRGREVPPASWFWMSVKKIKFPCLLGCPQVHCRKPGRAINLAGWPGKTVPDGVVAGTMWGCEIKLHCIFGWWRGFVGSIPGRAGSVLAICCSRQPQVGCCECGLDWCKVLVGRWRGCILSPICSLKRRRFSQGKKTGF